MVSKFRGVGHTGASVVLSEADPVLVQRVRDGNGAILLNIFNTAAIPAERLIEWSIAGCAMGISVIVEGHGSRLLCIVTREAAFILRIP